jgi:hypothetical protein
LSSLFGAKIYIHSIEYGRIRSIIHSMGFLKAILLRNGVPPFEIFLGISEALGHLEIMRERGMVRVKEKEGKDYYWLEA